MREALMIYEKRLNLNVTINEKAYAKYFKILSSAKMFIVFLFNKVYYNCKFMSFIKYLPFFFCFCILW